LVVGSTTGLVPGAADDSNCEYSFIITTVTDGSHLVVSSTTGMTAGDTIVQGNTLFTTTYPFKGSSLSIYLNGVKLMNGIDFVLNIPQQFTLFGSPESGDYLRVSYLKY